MDDLKPQWYLIDKLPMFKDMIDGMLESSLDQLKNMRRAIDKPWVLDDETMNRVFDIYTEQLGYHDYWMEQFSRWKKTKLNAEDKHNVDKLIKQANELQKSNHTILDIADQIKFSTINKIIDKNNAEIAVDYHLGKLKL